MDWSCGENSYRVIDRFHGYRSSATYEALECRLQIGKRGSIYIKHEANNSSSNGSLRPVSSDRYLRAHLPRQVISGPRLYS